MPFTKYKFDLPLNKLRYNALLIFIFLNSEHVLSGSTW